MRRQIGFVKLAADELQKMVGEFENVFSDTGAYSVCAREFPKLVD